jgi:protein O-mannosyl-transferase
LRITANVRDRIALVGAVLTAGLVYATALDNPFVYDDYLSVVQNPSIHPPLYFRSVLLYRATRPLVNASYALDRMVWGPDPFGFHLTSVLLHMLNVALLYVLTRRITEDAAQKGTVPVSPRVAAATAGFLLAAHPLMTEAVGYISGRSEVLCATFFLLAMLAARRWMLEGGGRWWIAMLLSWIAALGAKEIAAMFPVVLLAYDRLIVRGEPSAMRRRVTRLHLPLFAVASAGAAFRIAVFLAIENRNAPAIHWQYGLVELEVLFRYLLLMAVPMSQSIFHQVAPIEGLLAARAWLALGASALLGWIVWYARRVNPIASFGMLWFVLLLVPPAVLVMLDRGEPMAEHRLYVAACGLFCTAGATVGWMLKRMEQLGTASQTGIRVFLVVAVLSLCGHTLLRNAIWDDPVRLWVEAVEGAPQHWRAWLLLGEALYHANRLEEAVAAYQRALQLRPQELGGYVRLARYQAELGHLDDAAATYDRLQHLDPESSIASTGLGTVAMMAGRADDARRHFERSLELYPADITARQSLALIEESVRSNPEAALKQCEEIQRLAPATPGNDECISRNRSKLKTNDAHTR